jgi:membrane protease YdiL (CAAX protease family)
VPERSMIPSSLSLKWLYLAWLSLIFTIIVFGVIGTIVRGDPSDLILSWGLFSDIAIFAIALWDFGMILAAVTLLLLIRAQGRSPAAVGFRGSLTITGIVYAVLGYVVVLGIYHLTEIALRAIGVDMFWRGGSGDQLITAKTHLDWIVLFVGPVIVSPLTEELVFRGYVLNALLGKLSVMAAVAFSAVIFASVHIMFGPGLMVYIFLGAFVSTYLFIRFKSLYPCILMHFLTNLWAYIIVPLLFM